MRKASTDKATKRRGLGTKPAAPGRETQRAHPKDDTTPRAERARLERERVAADAGDHGRARQAAGSSGRGRGSAEQAGGGRGPRGEAPKVDEVVSQDTVDMMESLGALGAGPSALPDPLLDQDWIRSSGKTPIEFLTAVFRHPFVRMNERIAAAKCVVEYTHRKMPASVELTGRDGGPLRVTREMLSGLNDEELASMYALLDKAGRTQTLQ